jgi:ADP-ribose pyrophosphatase YjhB (NUDIX family)
MSAPPTCSCLEWENTEPSPDYATTGHHHRCPEHPHSRGLPRVQVGVIVTWGSRVLLGNRTQEPDFGAVTIPLGRVQPYESVVLAARRVVSEQTGIFLNRDLQFFNVYEFTDPHSEHVIAFIYSAEFHGGTPRDTPELSEVKFQLRVSAVEANLTARTRELLSDIGILPEAYAPSKDQVQPAGHRAIAGS